MSSHSLSLFAAPYRINQDRCLRFTILASSPRGYIAWFIGFLVRIPEHIPGLPASLLKADNPVSLYSFFVGFIIYLVLAKAGSRPPIVEAGNKTPQRTVV